MDNEKILEEAKERFADCEDNWAEQRSLALEDLRFARLGEQWPEEIKRQRELEKRPCLTINRLPSFIRQVVNDARLNKPSISVHPVDSGADVETAEIISGLIRNIEYTSDAEVAYDTALESAVTCGMGFFRISVDYTTDDVFDLDIKIERIPNPLSVYFDPYSTAADASDWSYCFVTEILPKDQFKQRYPKAEVSDWEGDFDGNWLSKDTVRVAEYWTREEEDALLLQLSDGTILYEDQYLENLELFESSGIQILGQRSTKKSVVIQRIISGSEILEENSWAGKYIPIVPVFGDEVVEESKRHFLSLVRQSKDAQMMYNFWRSASTELVALAPKAPFIGPSGAFDTDHEKWETANTVTHPYIEYDGQIPPQRQPFAGPPAGALQEALNASDDMKSIMGLHDASLGARSNETSGKAILARQREGDVSTFHYIDNLSRAIRYAGRVLLDLIPKVYKEPRVLRVMGMDDSVENVQVNQQHEKGGMVRMHDLTSGKYDLTVKTGPSFTTQREEAYTQMIQMVQAHPNIAPLIGDLIAKNADWPGAEEIAKRLKAMLPPQIQALDKMEGLQPEAQAAIAQMQQQLQQMDQVIQQGQQLLKEKDQQITELGLELKNKQGDQALKAREIEVKERIEQAKLVEGQRETIVNTMMEALKAKVDALGAFQSAPLQDLSAVLESVTGNSQAMSEAIAAFAEASAMIAAENATPKSKTVQIKAPSGAIYEGTVQEQ